MNLNTASNGLKCFQYKINKIDKNINSDKEKYKFLADMKNEHHFRLLDNKQNNMSSYTKNQAKFK